MPADGLAVLFATSECAPLVKTGGLADVSAALPAALRRFGIDARVLLPGYPAVLAAARPKRADRPAIKALAQCSPVRIVEATLPNGVPLIIVEQPSLYERPGGPYQSEAGEDWPDNALRFGLLSKVAAILCGASSPLAWRPQVVHCNDWQTGLTPAYLRFDAPPTGRCATVFTIHNLAYQGAWPQEWVARLDLPAQSYAPEGTEFHGRISFLKAALYYADAITTVSPTYAREIQTEALGFGMDGLLRWRRNVLTGILNGVDTEEWDPATDPLIARRYDAATLDAKSENKRELQRAMQLPSTPDVPLFGVVSRFIPQKGLDLLADIAAALVNLPAQLVVLGSGEGELERRFTDLAARDPNRLAVRIGFDNALAHLIEAGGDAFLMPSRFEPCGMNQMYSQRYGTPPIVRATGGLADAVVDCNETTLAAGTATGFVFDQPSTVALLAAIKRAVDLYRQRDAWRSIQRNGMARNFSWDRAVPRYAEIYRTLARLR
jgi:starch synthase